LIALVISKSKPPTNFLNTFFGFWPLCHSLFKIWTLPWVTKRQLPDHLWTTGHGLHTPGLSYAVFVARQSYQRGIFAMVLKWSFHHH